MTDTYMLIYWPGIPGRGEYIRLILEEAGATYIDTAQIPAEAGGGARAVMPYLRGEAPGFPPLAPPILKHGDLVLAQVANIALYLGQRHGLTPTDPAGLAAVNQLQLTITDLVAEVHDTHHPIATGLAYETQKPEALKRAANFCQARLPKFLGWFERVLTRSQAAGGEFLAGEQLCTADLSLFQTVIGLRHAFPRTMARVEPTVPRISELCEAVAARPRIAEYLASERRQPFGEGIFRRYVELDGD